MNKEPGWGERVWEEIGWQDEAETCSAGRGVSQVTAAS